MEGAKDGVNFAYGGTGVFKTGYDLPTMTTQIDFLQYLIANSTFTPQDINSSFALVSVSGNDYSYYLSTNGSIKVKNRFMRLVCMYCIIVKDVENFCGCLLNLCLWVFGCRALYRSSYES